MQEFMVCMNEQKLHKPLKEVLGESYDKLLVILQIQDRLKMKKAIMDLPAESSAFTEFVQYTLLDFSLNLLKLVALMEKATNAASFVKYIFQYSKLLATVLAY